MCFTNKVDSAAAGFNVRERLKAGIPQRGRTRIDSSLREGLFYRDRRNLSFPGPVHQYGRCFLKDGSRGLFSNGFSNYLNYCLFCLLLPPPLRSPSPPAPAFPVLRQTHLKSILKTKQELVFGAAHVGPLDAWGTEALFQSFYPLAI